MKCTLLTTISLLTASYLALAGPPTARRAESIDPGDLGIIKYSFEGAPEAGQLLIFRQESYRNDKLVDTYDTISCTQGDTHQEKVLLIDRTFFMPKADPPFSLRAANSQSNIEGSLKSWDGGGNRLTINFDSKQGPVKYVFTVFFESYGTVKKRVPDLPSESGKWTYAISKTNE